MNSSSLARLVGQLLEVGLVVARQDDPLQAVALGGEHLLADAADREHLAGERDLAGHADVLGDGLAAHERGDRGRDRDAGRGAVLRDRAGRDVDVHVVLGEPVLREAELRRRASAPTRAPPARTPSSRRRAGR